MSAATRFLAIDLGAESGRGVIGAFDGDRLVLEDVHRFANLPVNLDGTLYWDFLRLFGDVKETVGRAVAGGEVRSLGVDGWGVDFGLLDARGRLVSNPVHYRDARTHDVLDRLPIAREELYALTGIQFMEINTLVQLRTMAEAHDPDLERADRLLLMPDLVHHFLCGSSVAEYTNATTTQCLELAGGWATDVLARCEIPTRIFPDVVSPGTSLGREHEHGVEVIAPGTHDTASAVAGTPLAPGVAFLSSGTWSLLGLELEAPVVTPAAMAANLTNEGGVGGTIRLLRNIMGLWLVQEARRALGTSSYAELARLAEDAPAFTAFVDPDDPRFLRPGDLPTLVHDVCQETRQSAPNDVGTLVRVLLESLALKYAFVVRQLECVVGQHVAAVRIVGGGSQHELLCRLTAGATGLPVLAGPAEATSIGNLVVQAMAVGELGSIGEARQLVERSFPARCFEPAGDWAEPRTRFDALLRVGHTGGT
jgi:rhamnulokinase